MTALSAIAGSMSNKSSKAVGTVPASNRAMIGSALPFSVQLQSSTAMPGNTPGAMAVSSFALPTLTDGLPSNAFAGSEESLADQQQQDETEDDLSDGQSPAILSLMIETPRPALTVQIQHFGAAAAGDGVATADNADHAPRTPKLTDLRDVPQTPLTGVPVEADRLAGRSDPVRGSTANTVPADTAFVQTDSASPKDRDPASGVSIVGRADPDLSSTTTQFADQTAAGRAARAALAQTDTPQSQEAVSASTSDSESKRAMPISAAPNQAAPLSENVRFVSPTAQGVSPEPRPGGDNSDDGHSQNGAQNGRQAAPDFTQAVDGTNAFDAAYDSSPVADRVNIERRSEPAARPDIASYTAAQSSADDAPSKQPVDAKPAGLAKSTELDIRPPMDLAARNAQAEPLANFTQQLTRSITAPGAAAPATADYVQGPPIPFDQQFGPRVGSAISAAMNSMAVKDGTLLLQIAPEHLGKLEIAIDQGSDRLHITTENESVRSAIAQAHGRIEQELRSAGHRMQVDVAARDSAATSQNGTAGQQHQAGQSEANAQSQSQSQGQARVGHRDSRSPGGQTNDAPLPGPAPGQRPSSNIHYA